MNLKQLQHEVHAWTLENFEPLDSVYSLLGVVEEVGELAHSVLKSKQGIRGTLIEHRFKQKDAIGDIVIFLLDYCNKRGFDLEEILEETWNEVKQRDWKKFKYDGVSARTSGGTA